MIKIVIGGDTCPIGRNQVHFRKGDAKTLLGDLLPEFEQADLRIVNLECPLIEKEAPIAKCGPNLAAPIDCVKGLKAMGIDVVGLANNHIMDHGPQGLRTTIQALEQQGLDHVGAGENLEEARRILVREVNGVRIGLLALAEHEFCIAGRKTAGANPLNIIDAVRNIREHRSFLDCLIVLVHGGNEYYPYPGSSLMNTCRFLAEEGATAVICQHSHCTGCMEIHSGVPVIYGQGNLLFDMRPMYPTWHEGCLVHLTIDGEGRCEPRLVPYRQSEGSNGARRMLAEEETIWRCTFDERSRRLSDPAALDLEWRAFCRTRKRFYLHMIHGKVSLLRRIIGKLDLLHYLDRPDRQRRRLAIIRCESHRDALEAILESESAPQQGRLGLGMKGDQP